MAETWAQRIDRYIAEGRTVSGGKGSDSAAAVRDKEYAMQKQAFDMQMQQMQNLRSHADKYLSGDIGFSPQAMSGMTSQFLNSNSSTFNQAGQQVREALGARGNTGGNPVGGDYTRGLENLLGAKAGSQSQGLLGLQVQNQMQAQNNMWNAMNVESGNAAALTGTQGVSGNAMSNALNQYMSSMNSGFGASFGRSFGSSLGSSLGSFGMSSSQGPNGTTLTGSWGCWIAAACFDGWNDPRTIDVRKYLFGPFRKTWYGKIVTDVYLLVGERVAKKKWAVKLLKPLFEKALEKSRGIS